MRSETATPGFAEKLGRTYAIDFPLSWLGRRCFSGTLALDSLSLSSRPTADRSWQAGISRHERGGATCGITGVVLGRGVRIVLGISGTQGLRLLRRITGVRCGHLRCGFCDCAGPRGRVIGHRSLLILRHVLLVGGDEVGVGRVVLCIARPRPDGAVLAEKR